MLKFKKIQRSIFKSIKIEGFTLLKPQDNTVIPSSDTIPSFWDREYSMILTYPKLANIFENFDVSNTQENQSLYLCLNSILKC
jgi:hypothetical protein